MQEGRGCGETSGMLLQVYKHFITQPVCSSDGNGPPKSKRTKEMTTDTREAAGSSSSVTSTGPAALEGGVSSSGDIPATADPMHVIQ